MSQRPCSVSDYHLSLQEWNEYVDISAIDFRFSYFWVQLHNLPWSCLLIENALKIGSLLGEVLGSDDVSEERLLGHRFLRVRVMLN
ncbi:hypothetical protein Ancab_025099, partial [Ancistrocladus abbreviatus]